MSINVTTMNQLLSALPKAVIFTHFGSLTYKKYQEDRKALHDLYVPIFQCYLMCERITIVYVYVDEDFRKVTSDIQYDKEKGGFYLNSVLMDEDKELRNWLEQEVEQEARRQVKKQRPDLKFHFVGLASLIHLLNNIVAVDPELTRLLSGRGNRFGYDSPKFVEAVIRLARGDTPPLADHPVIRIDEDVHVNPDAITRLLYEYRKISQKTPFYFFSGCYGSPKQSNSTEPDDPVNDHAVRIHWFVPNDTKAGPKPEIPKDRIKAINHFLADLSVLGAKQMQDKQMQDASMSYSLTGRSILANRKILANKDQTTPSPRPPQVISGAGLILSSRAVRLLPPFMNFQHLTIWVDDYLKRRLHEALEDLRPTDIESVSKAKVSQDRHPNGITSEDKQKAKKEYLDRLLRGCMFCRIITELNGTPTAYSKLVAQIVRFEVRDNDPRVLPERPEWNILRETMLAQAGERYEEVLRCWGSKEYWDYASEVTTQPSEKVTIQSEEAKATDIKLNGEQIEQFLQALLSAFPTSDALRHMVRVRLEENLEAIAGREKLYTIAFNLIEWAIEHGRLKELIEKAYDQNPGNPKLSNFVVGVLEIPVMPPNTITDEPDSIQAAAKDQAERLPYDWIQERLPTHKQERCDEVVNDALAYLHLLLKWPIFVRAIERLSFDKNRWLYEPVKDFHPNDDEFERILANSALKRQTSNRHTELN